MLSKARSGENLLSGEKLQLTPSQAAEASQLAGNAGIVAAGNVAGRLLGLGREMAKSYYFGAGGAADALTIALRVPALIYDLFAGGMVNSALVPVFVDYDRENRARLWELLSVMASVGVMLFALFALLLFLLAAPVATVMNAGASPAGLDLTTRLLRLTAPAVLFLGLAGIFMGALYALKRFSIPAFAGVALNGGMVLAAVVLHERLGLAAMALGLLLGALVQLLLQRWRLRDAALSFHFDLSHPGLRRITWLYAPIFLGLLVEVLISRPLTYRLASLSGEGGISWMEYAVTLSQFPRGLVALGVSVAVLPLLAGRAAAERAGQAEARESFRAILTQGLRLILFLVVPASLGLLLLARPVVVQLLQHGSFTAFDSQMTSRALQLYLLTLPLAAVDGLLVYTFYARQDTLTPTLIGVGSVAFYLVLAFALFSRLGLFSLMVAEGGKLAAHTLISSLLLSRRLRGFGRHGVLALLGKTLLASLGMVSVLWVMVQVPANLDPASNLLHLLLLLAVGLAVFLALAAALNIQEVTLLQTVVKNQWQKVRSGP